MQLFEKHMNKNKKDSSNIERMKLLLREAKQPRHIKERSNVIQYDAMGYPLRLVINNKGEQEWLDTYKKEGDVILEWSKV